MRKCKFCGAEGEDGIIARHEQICEYVQKMGPVEIKSTGIEAVKDARADYVQTEPIEKQELPVTVTDGPGGSVCPQCGKVCKNASGLSAHMRTCKGV